MSPALRQLARDLAGQVKLVKVNVDEAPRLQARFTVEAVPTLMLSRSTRCSRASSSRAEPRSWPNGFSTATRPSRTSLAEPRWSTMVPNSDGGTSR
jgi:hypothetical protein